MSNLEQDELKVSNDRDGDIILFENNYKCTKLKHFIKKKKNVYYHELNLNNIYHGIKGNSGSRLNNFYFLTGTNQNYI